MGLHLCYELRLPEHYSPDAVDRILLSMYSHAATLPLEQVALPISIQPSKHWTRRRTEWLEFWASLIAKPDEEDIPPCIGDSETARGFLVNAGRECETATFGFLLRGDEAGSVREWYWHTCCKTQYASTVSNEHLIACHTGLVAILDHAVSLGVDVTVRDETHYWETRDADRLVSEVDAMNRIVARFAGKVSDALGSDHEAEAPIFGHPRFEYLEMGESND